MRILPAMVRDASCRCLCSKPLIRYGKAIVKFVAIVSVTLTLLFFFLSGPLSYGNGSRSFLVQIWSSITIRTISVKEKEHVWTNCNQTIVTQQVTLTSPKTLKSTNVPNSDESWKESERRLWKSQNLSDPCSIPRRTTWAEDILCMKPPKFLSNFKNPCWYDKGHLRCLPYFHLMGVCKSGTSDFFKRLCLHPDVIPNKGIFGKELWYWSWKRLTVRDHDNKKMPGMKFDGFISNFKADEIAKITRNQSGVRDFHPAVTGHGDPMDFWARFGWRNTAQNDPNGKEPVWTTPFSIRHVNPDVKLILMVREPVERLYSHYVYHTGKDSDTFTSNVKVAISVWKSCRKTRTARACAYDIRVARRMKVPLYTSMYSVHLKEWLRAFPQKQLFVIRSEDYYQDCKGTLQKVFKYLQIDQPPPSILNRMSTLEPFLVTKKKGKAGPMEAETKKILKQFFRPFVEEFADILKDKRFLWNDTVS